MEEPVLMMPDPTKQFILETDASKVACGAVLKQYHTDGELHPCGYISHTFTPTEKNYDVYDRELKAVVDAIDTWRQLLHGSPHPVIIHTDHKNLSYYKEARAMSGRQMRWCSKLMDYNLLWEHVPGNKNIQADALSRRPDHVQADEEEDPMVMPPLITPERIIANVAIRSTLLDLHKKILEDLESDAFGQQIITAIKSRTTPFKSDLADWELRDGLIFYQKRIYVPVSLWKEVVKLYHDTPITGHPGISKLTLMIQKEYFWPRMGGYIKKYVKGCALCQQMKPNTHPARHSLTPIKSEVDAPFQQVTCDFITDLPPSNGFDSIMVVVDHGLSKGVIYSPCNKTIDAKGTADLYIRNIWKRFGFPRLFISDRDPRFSSKVFQEIAKTMGIDQRMSTVFHPQTDGETERVNQELEVYLRMFCATNPEQWSAYLPMAEVDAPFQQVTCDFITDLPLSNGFDSIMVVVDHGLSKGVIYSPCNKTIDAKGTANLYIRNIWKRFGFPRLFISDRDPRFSSKVFQEIAKTMGIDQRMSTAFHPQTDGETERVNQELEVYLRMFCATNPEQWSAYLPMAEFAHNSRVHDAIKQTPFSVILGSDPIGIPTVVPRFSAPAAEEKTQELIRIRQEALAAHELARQVMYQRKQWELSKLSPGTMVWLKMKNIKGLYE